MGIIYRLFRLNKDKREDIITATSALGIIVNLFVAGLKVAIGAMVSSIAIISEGINNAADVMTSVLTLVGTKLAGKHPDASHPFGYGRIEYLTGLVISVIILVSGFEVLESSVKLIFEPAPLSVNYLALGIVAGSAVIKFFLGVYTIAMGKKAESNALLGVGLDCRNDSFASLLTIASILIFIIGGVSVDAYAGIVTSVLIIKAGFEVLKDTVGDLLGKPGDKELASELYSQIYNTPGIIGVADMMLHEYGPDRYHGSVNVEIDHEVSIGEAYRILHQLQLDIMHERNIVMVFGIYAVDNDHEEVKKLRSDITGFVKATEYVKSFHAVYLEPETHKIYVDFIVDYKLKDWDAVRSDFIEYMAKLYPGQEIELTIETEFI